MILSETQKLVLLQTLSDTLSNHYSCFSYDRETRLKLYNQIVNQQGSELKDESEI